MSVLCELTWVCDVKPGIPTCAAAYGDRDLRRRKEFEIHSGHEENNTMFDDSSAGVFH